MSKSLCTLIQQEGKGLHDPAAMYNRFNIVVVVILTTVVAGFNESLGSKQIIR